MTKGDLLYMLTSDKAIYESSEPVNLTFTITNRGQSNVQFVFPTSRFPHIPQGIASHPTTQDHTGGRHLQGQ